MSLLSRFRIITKLFAVVVLLSGVAVGITFVAIQALSKLNIGADTMRSAGGRALLAARLNQNVLALNRAEFRAALDPRPDNRAEARKVVDQNAKLFIERLDELAKARDEQAHAMMPAVKAASTASASSMP